jgi:nucleotide-binding universal stress UspA family protein
MIQVVRTLDPAPAGIVVARPAGMDTISRIVCAVDFSDVSQRALAHAAALARQHDARLTVLHVIPPAVPLATSPLDYLHAGAREVGDRERWTADVRRFAERFGDGRVHVAVAEGAVDAEIRATAGRLRADLVCLGTHGRSGFERWVLGSVTDKVLRKGRLPVMTVSPRCEPPPAEGAYRRVLCAVDLSPSSAFLVAWAARAARAAGAGSRLTLLHCVEDVPEDDTALRRAGLELRPYRRYREEQARTRLAELAATQGPGLCVDPAVDAGSPWRAILRCASELGDQLIVMGAHAGEDAAHLGSNTDRVVREAGCPVVTVRPSGALS